MKIIGQGFVDSYERFFHGMYVSAQGNPFLDGNTLDGMNPLAAILGPYTLTLMVVVIVAALLIGSYLFMGRRAIATPKLVQPS